MSLHIYTTSSGVLVFDSQLPDAPGRSQWLAVEHNDTYANMYDVWTGVSGPVHVLNQTEMEKFVEEFVDEEIIGTPEL